VIACSFKITYLHYFIPYGLGATVRYCTKLVYNSIAYTSCNWVFFSFSLSLLFLKENFEPFCSTRVSNVLGAGNPQAAKMAVWAVMVLAITEVIVISRALFFCRHILGYASRSEEDIVKHVADMDPFICLSVIMDRLQPVLSGKCRSFFSCMCFLGQNISLSPQSKLCNSHQQLSLNIEEKNIKLPTLVDTG
jgi:hypothetical protein